MIRRILWASLFYSFWFAVSVPGIGGQGSAPPRAAGEAEKSQDLFSRFRWLTASEETRGLILEQRRLESLKVSDRDLSSAEVETETARPGADSMRITRRVFERGVNGERRLLEVVTEDLRATGKEGISATRTVSHRDANGSMRILSKETQETVPAGPDTYRTQLTVMTPNSSGTLAPSEQVRQTEKKAADGTVEIEKTKQQPGINGGWVTADRRVSSCRETANALSAQEDVYQSDANGKLSLIRREVSREWQDREGKTIQERETSLAGNAGKLELNSRLSIVSTSFQDGSRETTQTLMQKSLAAPLEGLRLVEQVSEIQTPVQAGASARETWLQVPDGNGKLQTIVYLKTTEKK